MKPGGASNLPASQLKSNSKFEDASLALEPSVAMHRIRRTMDRRGFLKSSAFTSAAAFLSKQAASQDEGSSPLEALKGSLICADAANVQNHTRICEFKLNGDNWRVYENLRTRDGVITFVSSAGARVFTKTAEASFAEETTPYLGLSLKEIGLYPRDLLAVRLIECGDNPDHRQLKSSAT